MITALPQRPPFKRRLWLYLTVAKLAAIALGGLAIIVFFTAAALVQFALRRYEVAIAAFIVAAILLFLAFVWVIILRRNIYVGMRRELRRRNSCPNCQYDLRASSLRCPECGFALPAANIEI
jgi:hypothetical protein